MNVAAGAWQPETAALIYSEEDAWSRFSAAAFRSAAEDHGIEIITEADGSRAGGDFSAQIEAIDGANPDIMLLNALELPSIDFVTQARDLGIEQGSRAGMDVTPEALLNRPQMRPSV